MRFDEPRHCSFTARLDCHYLLYAPDSITESTLLVAALHGYGQTPEVMLRLSGSMLGQKHVIAAVQAPYPFYLSQAANQVGYCWITNRHSESSIRLHHEMMRHIFAEVGRECGIPSGRRILLGFSQPVGLNYRFAATHPAELRGVIGVCGGIPKNWEDGPYRKMQAAVLHIARREDEFYKPEATERYPERLRLRADDVEFHLLEGGHRFPSKAAPLADAWIARVFGASRRAPSSLTEARIET